MPRYFAYGSNMDLARMEARNIKLTSRIPATLKKYKLTFNKITNIDGIGFATIEKGKETDFVEGALYDISAWSVIYLDRYEGFPFHYKRIKIKVSSGGIDLPAFTYIATDETKGYNLLPTQEYLNYLLNARDILSEEYFIKLSQQKCFSKK